MPLVKPHLPASATSEFHSALKHIANERIFFAHQSVGSNILSGIKEIYDRHSMPLRIIETDEPVTDHDPFLAHCRIGSNGDPVSKVSDFSRLLEAGFGEDVGVALLKLCYVDVTRETDVEALADHYLQQLERLANRYTNLNLVTCTVPLTVRRQGFKARVARLLGHPDTAVADNLARTQFNERLRNRPGDSVQLFDLAEVESGRSTHPGTEPTTSSNGPSLHAAFSSDGGHLNRFGSRIVAEALIRTLGRILQ